MINKTVYHGDDYIEINHDKVFFSTDPNFASDYGEVKPYQLTLNNPFYSYKKQDVTKLISMIGLLTDSYDDTEYRSFEELDDSGLLCSDSWGIFENHVDSIKSMGYDGIVIFEGGIENYLTFDSSQYKIVET